MRANIRMSLARLNPVRLLALLRNVVARMAGNIHFPAPPITMVAMGTLADDLETAITEATNGSRQSRLLRDDLVTQGRDMLRTQGNYVRLTGNGDRTKLESSGFPLAKVPVPVGPVGVPFIRFVQMTGIAGQVLVLWTGVHGAHFYCLYSTEEVPATPGVKLTLVTVTKKVRHTVEGLEPYTPVWFLVSAVGAAGEGPKSDPAMGRASA